MQWKSYHKYMVNFLVNLLVKKFQKLVYCQSYDQNEDSFFFEAQSTVSVEQILNKASLLTCEMQIRQSRPI